MHPRKIVVFGSKGVGKTSLINQLVSKEFHEKLPSTVMHDFQGIAINNVNCMIWDAAQSRGGLDAILYSEVDGALLVFSLTDKESFEKLEESLASVRKMVGVDVPIRLVGNKEDLTDECVISKEEIDNFVKLNNLTYVAVSAKNYASVSTMFSDFINELNVKLESEYSEEEMNRSEEEVKEEKLTEIKEVKEDVVPEGTLLSLLKRNQILEEIKGIKNVGESRVKTINACIATIEDNGKTPTEEKAYAALKGAADEAQKSHKEVTGARLRIGFLKFETPTFKKNSRISQELLRIIEDVGLKSAENSSAPTPRAGTL